MKALVKVDLGARSYPIYIEQTVGVFAQLSHYISSRQVCIVTNETIAPLYLEQLMQHLQDFDCIVSQLPDGEAYKCIESAQRVYDDLIDHRFSRQSTLIALGGGVIGDLTGFVAATWQRGVPYIQVPTTLLSQVDSSVGGKTGINHPQGKNMIGAFHQPQAVCISTDVLSTLAQRQLASGMAEVVKYGLIYDVDFLEWIENNLSALLARDAAALRYAIQRSCEIKAAVVAADELEGGVRAWLNLGHTFGHAIEALMGYGEWLHGEAIAAGMVMAADLSYRQGSLSAQDFERVCAIFLQIGLPIKGPQLPVKDYLMKMASDKKVADGAIRLVLLRQLGKAYVTADYDKALLHAVIAENSGA